MYTCEKIIGIRDSFYLITMMMITDTDVLSPTYVTY